MGIREMCSWECYCAFAREPETRKVGSDARVQVGGAHYEVDADLSGEEVLLWWGLFEQELFVEWRDQKYHPRGGALPLHRYRKPGKSKREKRADTVAALADQISLPRQAVSGALQPALSAEVIPLLRVAFADPDPCGEVAYANVRSARRAIADLLRRPLGELGKADLDFISAH